MWKSATTGHVLEKLRHFLRASTNAHGRETFIITEGYSARHRLSGSPHRRTGTSSKYVRRTPLSHTRIQQQEGLPHQSHPKPRHNTEQVLHQMATSSSSASSRTPPVPHPPAQPTDHSIGDLWNTMTCCWPGLVVIIHSASLLAFSSFLLS